MRHAKRFFLLVSLLIVGCISFFSCRNKVTNPKSLFQLMDSTGIDFFNRVEDEKLNNSFLFRNFYNGGGVAIGDINNDGLPDVFLTSNASFNKLFLNKGDFKFEDIGQKAGIIKDDKWNTGVVFADINGDGWLDIYVCSSGHMNTGNRKNKLYINNQDLSFTESAAAYGLDISAYSTQASFFDYDLDGDLDCFIINNSPIPVNQLGFANRRDLAEKDWPVAEFLKGGGDHLFQNNGGKFIEVTKKAGIHGSLISFGLGVSVGDINLDGYPDVFVSNDSYERDYLYINQKNGTFIDELQERFQHTSFSSMGADIADINNDGYPDLFSTDMLPLNDFRIKTTGSFDNIDMFNSKLKAGFYYQYIQNCLQLNNQDGTFSDIANYSGVANSDWSWGALMFDMDNDGWNDLYVCNGVNRDVTNLDFMDFFANETYQKMVMTGQKNELDQILKKIPRTPLPNKVYKNNRDLKFTEVAETWGLAQPSFSNGAAYADLDNDGDLDLIVCTENQSTLVYKNNARQQNKYHFTGAQLKGSGKNTFGIGSRILVYTSGQILSREIVPSRGFQSSVDYKIIIGLGNAEKIDSMHIIWPDRSIQRFLQPEMDKVFSIQQGVKDSHLDQIVSPLVSPIFSHFPSSFPLQIEDPYIDFYYERNIPRMLSTEGPKATKGDVNDDGLDDLYIGGAKNQEGRLYLQTASGRFVEKTTADFKQFADFEDVACLMLDVDSDADLDLFVGAGGNTSETNSRELQHRLYKNDGKANFTIDTGAFPNNPHNTAVAADYDFDQDGDFDLFVGARNITQQYGATPTSHIYVNNGYGKFKELGSSAMADIAQCGLVTGAVWADLIGDKQKELIVVGEWMEPKIYTFEKGRFSLIKSNLSQLHGWWQTVAAADLNGDGREDLILGNVGENGYLHPDSSKPIKLWVKDFDQNGLIDKILTYTINRKDLPVFLKRDLTDQIPSLKKQNLLHSAYATKSIQELFGPELLADCLKKQFNYTASCVAINQGLGNFAVKKLPERMQLSSVNTLLCTDINEDGKTDIIAGGNLSCFLPQLERLDASYGNLLLNDGKGNFSWIASKKSGLFQRGDVKDIVEVNGKNKKFLLVLQNNDYPILYQRHNNK